MKAARVSVLRNQQLTGFFGRSKVSYVTCLACLCRARLLRVGLLAVGGTAQARFFSVFSINPAVPA
jgi:hypothetical protein